MPSAGDQVYDVVILGGTLLDGSGGDPVRADIGIRGDRIAAIGRLSTVSGGRVIDATGMSVAPGFIDIHTHSDISLTYDPGQASSVSMGVTTQVTGNCGLCLALATPDSIFAFEKRWLSQHNATIRWNSFAENLRIIEETGVATNVVPLAGHGTLRKRVMGMAERKPDEVELQSMQCELAQALEDGAWGFSSGLEYPPSSYADAEELTELCRTVAEAGGIYATHLRNEGDRLVEAVEEALLVSSTAAVSLQLSHHKAEGARNWGKIVTTLRMIDAARESGHDVQLDQYPYTAFMTSLAVQTVPGWAMSGTSEEVAARFSETAQRSRIVNEMLASHPDWATGDSDSSWNRIRIGVCRGKPEIQGRTIASLAADVGKPPIDYVLDLIVETHSYVSATNFSMDEADIAEVMRHPFTSIGSDGVGTHPGGPASEDAIHPRAYGTFPRVLGRYVRELNVLTETEAIRRMTWLPADRLGLKERGRLTPGAFADVVVYDPDTVIDRATFDEPHQYADGIRCVIVNGAVAFQDGQPTDARTGRVLRK